MSTVASRAAYYQANKAKFAERNHKNNMRRKYGVSADHVETMKIAQNGRCLCCNEETKLVVDHCHNTGKVRGLLCYLCNRHLGIYEHGRERYAAYLKRFEYGDQDPSGTRKRVAGKKSRKAQSSTGPVQS